ncbi:phosphatase PAP2 family protein [Streptomyces sviceus]|uniref:Integral membrane protein n=1 Tax=Streptomyces sviceus (strain ATCC 29083 / DSM 924 / JCM 4929 / NBRC 13980 / NCIMB 11184 / NRRL 5439 / UC 5370) TaxID=463191 RepID=B5HWW0_STRX2|nr:MULTISPECIES: phosphatase PAP2 family protein [Streptomyces]EDY57315.1 integral membrane protein [Streptomyces sviceus ATCC 29083]MYT08727.1 phosphatase PAP2 family protein [Streptomyces sp. SID5470]
MGDIRTGPPQLRPGRALAHTTGASGSGSPHRSDSRPPQTPRGGRRTDLIGRPGTTPPVPGRPAFLILLLGIPALLFALITWQVVEDGPLLRVDERISRALIHPDRVSAGLADLGNVEVALPVLVVALLWSARQARRAGTDRWWLPSTAAAALMALVPALVVPLKELTDRPGTVVSPGTGYYPSGHTATAAVAYGAATLLVLPWLRSARTRRALVIGYGLLVLGVSFGLVRRGWHWPLDVVGSWCLCTVLLQLLAMAFRRYGRKPAQDEST